MRHLWLYAALIVGCHAPEASVPVATTQTTVALLPPTELPAAVVESNDPPRDGERVVTRLRPRFRSCYERGLLEEDRRMSGVVVVHLRVAPDGTVRAADVVKRTGLSSGVASCISRQAQSATFEAPGPGGASLDVPVHFVRSSLATH